MSDEKNDIMYARRNEDGTISYGIIGHVYMKI